MKKQLTAACIVFALFIPGCSQGPSGPARPAFSPTATGNQAIEKYDANGDGKIDLEEAESSPGLRVAFSRIDQDADSSLSKDEIADRVRYYKSASTAIVDGGVKVTVRGRPIEGAIVTFEPEAFLGEAFKSSRGETNATGNTYMKGTDAKFPGLYLGMYRVRISKKSNGKEIIPTRYNTETTLGYEAADDIPNVSRGIEFDIHL